MTHTLTTIGYILALVVIGYVMVTMPFDRKDGDTMTTEQTFCPICQNMGTWINFVNHQLQREFCLCPHGASLKTLAEETTPTVAQSATVERTNR